MISKKNILFIALLVLTNTAMGQVILQTGIWRGALQTSSGNELPFNFTVTDTISGQLITIINGDERFKVTDIKSQGDSVFIKMPLFDSEFKLKLTIDSLSGNWIKHGAYTDAVLPFTAKANRSYRFFKDPAKTIFDVTGRWSVVFGENEEKEQVIGEFKQNGNKLTGTFLSTTGDYRFLEGAVNGNKLYLSCFDGGHAYIFTATISDDNTLTEGLQFAGYSSITKWKGIRNKSAKLPDAYSLTVLKPGYKKIDFTFKDINGQLVSLHDGRFKNKVVIVQILGSWCPNCMDETNYFTGGYYKKYHPLGVEIIGLAYERTTDYAKSQKTLMQLKNHFDVPYPLLITGYTPGNGDPQKSLPMLANFKGFPTTIIIDKNGNVRKIHTGFSGPGTGDYYKEFSEEFEKLTDNLLAEKAKIK